MTIKSWIFVMAALAVFFIAWNFSQKALVRAQEDDFWDLVYIIHAEAGNQDLTGKKLVADVVLNRVYDDRFPDSIHDVIFQPGQFSPVTNGAFEKAKSEWTEEDYLAALEETVDQIDYEILYFASNGYNGKPMFKYGAHYFSK